MNNELKGGYRKNTGLRGSVNVAVRGESEKSSRFDIRALSKVIYCCCSLPGFLVIFDVPGLKNGTADAYRHIALPESPVRLGVDVVHGHKRTARGPRVGRAVL